MRAAPYIQFYPTMRCNSSCFFCFNKGLQDCEDVTVRNFEKMLSSLRKRNIGCVDILGGEPTLHPHILTLLDMLRGQGMKSNLSSNGTNVSMLYALSERFPADFLTIGISLNSAEVPEDLHNYILAHRPVLKSVMTNPADPPPSCEKYAGLPGIDCYLLYMDAVTGEDLKQAITFPDYYRALQDWKKGRRGMEGVYCSGFISGAAVNPVKKPRCPAGTEKLSLRPDGAVYPCYLFFRFKEFELGNILRDDFQSIWDNPRLDYFRASGPNTCPESACPLFASCSGGCPAVSYIFHRDLTAPDPRCRPISSPGTGNHPTDEKGTVSTSFR